MGSIGGASIMIYVYFPLFSLSPHRATANFDQQISRAAANFEVDFDCQNTSPSCPQDRA